MPILTVCGIRNVTSIADLKNDLRVAASSIPELGIEEGHIVPIVMAEQGDVEPREVILFIDLFPREERTPQLLEQMQMACAKVLRSYCDLEICCYIRPLDPAERMSFVLPAGPVPGAATLRF